MNGAKDNSVRQVSRKVETDLCVDEERCARLVVCLKSGDDYSSDSIKTSLCFACRPRPLCA